ncbi:MAG: hypothetical protein EVG15_02675 [Candidatus Acididesulfobacter diazotrophicus]|jgi:hypothetical protein|uniref:Uncharacterized protein n=1 Tax=Candidatus Acididesulfobacter diazotrophicus TaxID=2597226 RepID=A0A519BP27_9DELT|nr:MAG: hypothetical protein EVG15_02675 [Candidatus Acididesulfobacter diazotrophicus]
MKKLIIALLLFFGLFGFIGKAANAIEINENCTNGACVATAGGIKIYFSWNMNGSLNQYINNMPYSAITGINGLPVTVSNYKEVIHSINKSKTVSNNLINEIDKKTGISIPEITGVNIGNVKSTKSEDANDIAKSMSQELSSSNQININYNLSFCNFIGKNFTITTGGFNHVLSGALMLIRYYRQNNFKAIDSLLQLYILSTNHNIINEITVFAPVTDANASLINYKYMKIAGIVKHVKSYINYFATDGRSISHQFANQIEPGKIQSALYNTLIKGQTIEELAKKHPFAAKIEYLSVKNKKPYPNSYAKRFIYYYENKDAHKGYSEKSFFGKNLANYKKYKNYVLIKPAINYNIVFIVAGVVLIGGIIGGFVIAKRKRQK